MAMVTLTSAYNTNLSKTLPFENKNKDLRDVSFSSYLNSSEETIIRKFPEPGRELSPKIANEVEHHYMGRKKEDDGEIGVFGAEKYFNEGIGEASPRIAKIDARDQYQYVKDEGIHLDPVKPKMHNGTPSVHSESSWNSQRALLQSFMRSQPQRKTKVSGRSFLAGLGCNCACADKNSVDVDEHVGEISFKRSANGDAVQSNPIIKAPAKTNLEINKPLPEPWVKEDPFTFPTVNSLAGIRPVRVPIQQGEEEIARRSLEVFGSPVVGRRNKFLNLEKRLTMLSWNANPRVEETEFSATSKGNYNDTESDASSDLFEIESLTGKANPFLVRQASDATSGCVTPTTCYAPSEASIEWSVVTASAADYSVMSDCEEIRSAITIPSPIKTFSAASNAKARNNKETQRRRSNSLLGCNSHKAVKVAGDANRAKEKATFDPRLRRVSDSYMPVTRFRAETKLASLDSRQRQQVLATSSYSRDHSPRASQLLYIQ